MDRPVNVYDEEDTIIFTDISNEIKKIADKKIVHLHKLHRKHIDTNAIYEQAKDEYLTELVKELNDLLSYHNELLVDHAKFDHPETAEKFKKKSGAVGEKVANCKTWHELKQTVRDFHATDKEKKELDHVGVKHFQEHDYLTALANFTLLCSLDFSNAEYWLKKGMAEQNFTSAERALRCYSLAIYFDPTLIQTYIQVMECFILLHALDQAKEVYDAFMTGIDHHTYKNDPLICSKLENISNFLTHPVY